MSSNALARALRAVGVAALAGASMLGCGGEGSRPSTGGGAAIAASSPVGESASAPSRSPRSEAFETKTLDGYRFRNRPIVVAQEGYGKPPPAGLSEGSYTVYFRMNRKLPFSRKYRQTAAAATVGRARSGTSLSQSGRKRSFCYRQNIDLLGKEPGPSKHQQGDEVRLGVYIGYRRRPLTAEVPLAKVRSPVVRDGIESFDEPYLDELGCSG